MSTISHVFPFVTIWKASDADIIILASATPILVDFDAMQKKMNQPEIAGDLARIKMYDIPTLLSTQVISARNNPFVTTKNELNTAEKSALEFMAPVPLFTHESVSILDSLDERFTFQDKNLWFSEYVKTHELSFGNYMNIARYRSTSHIGDLALAWSALRKAVELDAENAEALAMLSKTAGKLGLPDVILRKSQLDDLRALAEANPYDNSVIFQYLNALVEYYRIDNSIVNPQQMNDAVELMKRSIQFSPGNEEQFRYILAMILTGAGRYDEAAEAFTVLLQFENQNGTGAALLTKNELIFNIGESFYNAGNLDEAENYFKQLQPVSADAGKLMIIQRKIALKKAGFK
jgi:tetratricopeptide (TPR) repeat protein